MKSLGASPKAGIAEQRSILFSARVRLSPQTQPIRESALDNLVEQLYLIADKTGGLTLSEASQRIREGLPAGSAGFPDDDVHKSIRRLAIANRLSQVAGGSLRYRLTTTAAEDLRQRESEAQRRVQRVTRRLFKNSAPDYPSAFMEALAVIFGRLGDEYAKALKGDTNAGQTVAGSVVIHLAVRYCRRQKPTLDSKRLTNAIVQFIQDGDPDSSAIKWNMAQNYYLAAALGLDPHGSLLSAHVLGSSNLYLDSNVVLAAIEPSERHHNRFQVLQKACASLKIQLRVCQITVNELRGVVAFQKQIIRQVNDQIPDATAPKVRSIFFQLFRKSGLPADAVALDELFAPFEAAATTLKDRYGVELIDDPWFVAAQFDERIQTIAEFIQEASAAYRTRPKTNAASLHDAMLLGWVDREQGEGKPNSWIVTLDRTLPPFAAEGNRPRAISLDALLQWISPIAVKVEDEDEVAGIFAQALAYHLLPKENIFDLRDFTVFTDLAMECRELPSDDVERCVQELRRMPGRLDPGKPEDREKMAHVISRFFADPGRAYRHSISKLEAKVAALERDKIEAVNSERLLAAEKLANEREQSLEALKATQSAWERRERELTKAIDDANDRAEAKRVELFRRSAYVRLAVGCLAAVVCIAASVILALRYAEGGNALRKIVAFWPLLVLAGGIGVLIVGLFVGEERRQVFPRFFRRRLQ